MASMQYLVSAQVDADGVSYWATKIGLLMLRDPYPDIETYLSIVKEKRSKTATYLSPVKDKLVILSLCFTINQVLRSVMRTKGRNGVCNLSVRPVYTEQNISLIRLCKSRCTLQAKSFVSFRKGPYMYDETRRALELENGKIDE